ncbi:hypothetical protein EV363DRAFT_1178468 [Boletus edulis]|nr:hypothetical protein EV363DRAFT_1178468 [Boletus edulis]
MVGYVAARRVAMLWRSFTVLFTYSGPSHNRPPSEPSTSPGQHLGSCPGEVGLVYKTYIDTSMIVLYIFTELV